jgi:hypothetical protein
MGFDILVAVEIDPCIVYGVRAGCLCRRNSRGYLVKRKHMLIKVNVPGSEHTVGDGIVAPISLGGRGVADEDASDRSRCKLVRSSVGSARIAKAPKNMQVVIRRGRTKEKMVRCVVPPWAAGSNVKKK